MQTIDKFSSILDIHEWARANNNLNFEKYKKIYELLINLYDNIMENNTSRFINFDDFFEDEKIKDFANPKIILFLSIAIPITLAYLKPCYGEYKREFSKEFLEQYDVNSLYEDLCESKWFYRFNNITPRNSNPKTIKKHRAFQKDLQATCQQEIWLLSKMLKDSKYTVSKVCGMSSNLTLQILQRKQDSMFGSSLMEVKN